jgi:hypothetical protein
MSTFGMNPVPWPATFYPKKYRKKKVKPIGKDLASGCLPLWEAVLECQRRYGVDEANEVCTPYLLEVDACLRLVVCAYYSHGIEQFNSKIY